MEEKDRISVIQQSNTVIAKLCPDSILNWFHHYFLDLTPYS